VRNYGSVELCYLDIRVIRVNNPNNPNLRKIRVSVNFFPVVDGPWNGGGSFLIFHGHSNGVSCLSPSSVVMEILWGVIIGGLLKLY
jgi:hypothetical protein